jgi:hypothetical protein
MEEAGHEINDSTCSSSISGLVLRAETGIFEAVRNGDLAMMSAAAFGGRSEQP